MSTSPELVLIGAVAAIGIFHTVVPDHWVPIALVAHQFGWSRGKTARASLQAGIGHVLSTLIIAAIVWLADVAVAARFGRIVDQSANVVPVLLGGWIAISAVRTPRLVGDGMLKRKSPPPSLLLLVGSSPMVEGIPAFFQAAKYGLGLITVMSIVFAVCTIATYMVLCVYSTVGMKRLGLGGWPQYGEVVSGTLIALIGIAFWLWPIH